jgi:hypothetical protein
MVTGKKECHRYHKVKNPLVEKNCVTFDQFRVSIVNLADMNPEGV